MQQKSTHLPFKWWALALAPALAAATANGQQPVSVTIRDDTVRLVRAGNRVTLQTTAVVHNTSGRQLYYRLPCGYSLHRRFEGRWERVWPRDCTMAEEMPISFAAGDSVVFDVRFYATTDGTVLPVLDPRVTPGLYRLSFAILDSMANGKPGAPRRYLPVELRSSAPFPLREIP